MLPKFRGDCGSDHELLIAKFRLKLKKVGKTTRPFKYDLNQIPYDCTVEVRNRFKGLDLIDRVPDELWTEVRDIVNDLVLCNGPLDVLHGAESLLGSLAELVLLIGHGIHLLNLQMGTRNRNPS